MAHDCKKSSRAHTLSSTHRSVLISLAVAAGIEFAVFAGLDHGMNANLKSEWTGTPAYEKEETLNCSHTVPVLKGRKRFWYSY